MIFISITIPVLIIIGVYEKKLLLSIIFLFSFINNVFIHLLYHIKLTTTSTPISSSSFFLKYFCCCCCCCCTCCCCFVGAKKEAENDTCCCCYSCCCCCVGEKKEAIRVVAVAVAVVSELSRNLN